MHEPIPHDAIVHARIPQSEMVTITAGLTSHTSLMGLRGWSTTSKRQRIGIHPSLGLCIYMSIDPEGTWRLGEDPYEYAVENNDGIVDGHVTVIVLGSKPFDPSLAYCEVEWTTEQFEQMDTFDNTVNLRGLFALAHDQETQFWWSPSEQRWGVGTYRLRPQGYGVLNPPYGIKFVHVLGDPFSTRLLVLGSETLTEVSEYGSASLA